MAQTIPLQADASQLVTVNLAQQPCKISVYQRNTGLYVDLLVNDAPIALGIIAENANRIVRYTYLGFAGDLVFYDTQGDTDPYYTGLGGRYVLLYLAEGEDVPIDAGTPAAA